VTRRLKTRDLGVSHVLAIEHPIMLAPMGSATGRKLASAVTNAGGQDMSGSGSRRDDDPQGAQ
jgi:nitronate monooxygenase